MRGALALKQAGFAPFPPDPVGTVWPRKRDPLENSRNGFGDELAFAVWSGDRTRRQRSRAEPGPPIGPVTTPRKGQQVRDAPEPDGTFLGRWESQARDTDKHP